MDMQKTWNENIHLLLPRADLDLLKRQAHSERKSVAELIRRAIRKVYGVADPNKRQAAYERLSKRSELVMEDWEVVKKDLLTRYE